MSLLLRRSHRQLGQIVLRRHYTTCSTSYLPLLNTLRPISREVSSRAPVQRTFSTSTVAFDSKKIDEPKHAENAPSSSSLSVVQKFKKLFKDYWYVLVPVHVGTSVVWLASFYALCKSGVDVASIFATLGVPQDYVAKLQDSHLGYYALTLACMKVAAPLRYATTIGGTTVCVKVLKDAGILKTSKQVVDNIRERKEEIKEKVEDNWEKGWQRFDAHKKRRRRTRRLFNKDTRSKEDSRSDPRDQKNKGH